MCRRRRDVKRGGGPDGQLCRKGWLGAGRLGEGIWRVVRLKLGGRAGNHITVVQELAVLRKNTLDGGAAAVAAAHAGAVAATGAVATATGTAVGISTAFAHAERGGSVEDWTVASAPAEVAIEPLRQLLSREARRAAQSAIHGHHNAGGAEAALRPVQRTKPRLDRVHLARAH
eukprot:scaffold66575_cov31-Tisochrysis_lutea.AAC.1